MIWFLVIVAWIVCGTFAYAIAFAEFQRGFPTIAAENRRSDAGFSIILGLFGPIALVVILCLSGFAEHGLKWRIKSNG